MRVIVFFQDSKYFGLQSGKTVTIYSPRELVEKRSKRMDNHYQTEVGLDEVRYCYEPDFRIRTEGGEYHVFDVYISRNLILIKTTLAGAKDDPFLQRFERERYSPQDVIVYLPDSYASAFILVKKDVEGKIEEEVVSLDVMYQIINLAHQYRNLK